MQYGSDALCQCRICYAVRQNRSVVRENSTACAYLYQANHENRTVCDGGCKHIYTEDEGTPQELCGVGSGDNSHTVRKKRAGVLKKLRMKLVDFFEACKKMGEAIPMQRWCTLVRCIVLETDLRQRHTRRPEPTRSIPCRKMTSDDYQSACDAVMPWYVLSLTIAACTVPYRCVRLQPTTIFLSSAALELSSRNPTEYFGSSFGC